MIEHPAYAVDPWCLRETALDLDVLAQSESLFALSNGHQHKLHIRTTNAIESTFATLRHRTKRVKGAFSEASALAMMLQLGLEAQKRWHRITSVEQLGQLIEGVRFVDGVAQLAA